MMSFSRIQIAFALSFGYFILYWIPRLGLGNGSSLPGLIAAYLSPHLMKTLFSKATRVIFVTGTNGKTTTTKLLATLFGEEKVLYNASGANQETGILTSLIKGAFEGNLEGGNLILEVDERTLLALLEIVEPDFLICLNLFRDQQDRYGEMDKILHDWERQMKRLSSTCQLIFNGDDPALVALAQKIKKSVEFFGMLNDKKGGNRFSHAVDSKYCPHCHIPLSYSTIYLSHLGAFECESCSFSNGKPSHDSQKWPTISPFVHHHYNTLAALTVAHHLGIQHLHDRLHSFTPAFGRDELLEIEGKEVVILLSKNAVSMNASLEVVKNYSPWGILFLLNDHEPDGRDVSWIWDADYEEMGKSAHLYLSGKRAYDMALCLHYQGQEKLWIDPVIPTLIQKALNDCPRGQRLAILPNYTAMLAARKFLTGKTFAEV